MTNYEDKFLSDCCEEPVDTITTLDGSNPKRCRRCKKPCDYKCNKKGE